MQSKAWRSPPGYLLRHMLIVVNWLLLIGSPASIELGNLFACVPAACSSSTHRPINRTLLLTGLWLHFSPYAEISRTARALKSNV